MSSQQFRLIPIQKADQFNIKQREARGASGNTLIPDGYYLFPTEWDENSHATSNSIQESVLR
jgi:hypothetical protein